MGNRDIRERKPENFEIREKRRKPEKQPKRKRRRRIEEYEREM